MDEKEWKGCTTLKYFQPFNMKRMKRMKNYEIGLKQMKKNEKDAQH